MQRTGFFFSFVSVLILAGCAGQGSSSQSASADVQQAASAFLAALETGDSDTAATLIDQTTASHFARLRDLAAGDAPLPDNLAFDDLLVIGWLRLTRRGEIADLDPEAVFRDVVDEALILAAMDTAVLDVSPNGDQAQVEVSGVTADTVETTAVRENGEWRINALPLIEAESSLVSGLLKDRGKSEREHVRDLLGGLYDVKVPGTLLD